MKNIPIGSWKKYNDYAWSTDHGNSFHTPIVGEIELHKITVLTDRGRPFYLTWNITYSKEDFVVFNYTVRRDDEENRVLLFTVLIKRLQKNTIIVHSLYQIELRNHMRLKKQIRIGTLQDQVLYYIIREALELHYDDI